MVQEYQKRTVQGNDNKKKKKRGSVGNHNADYIDVVVERSENLNPYTYCTTRWLRISVVKVVRLPRIFINE